MAYCRQWRYVQLRGLPFGFGSAANQFSRVAAFLTAVNRRLLHVLTGNYVDDNATIERSSIANLEGSGPHIVKESARLLGVLLSDSKLQAPSTVAHFLGHLHDWSRTALSGQMVWAPQLGAHERLTELCHHAVNEMRMFSGLASKVRGLATWLNSGLGGRCLRGATCALTASQYWRVGGDHQ